MAIQQNYPSTDNTLILDFVNRPRLDPRITFTRSSTGAYTNAQGYIVTAGANTARFDYDPIALTNRGLLIESQRTNTLLYSQVFDSTNSGSNWVNTAAPIISNSTVSPAGDLTAYALYQDTSVSVQHAVFQNGPTLSATTNTAFSCYGKSVANTQSTNTSIIRLIVYDNANTSNNFSASFNVANGVITTNPKGGSGNLISAGMTSAGNGWYRCYVSGNTAGSINYQYRINIMNATNSSTYTGDGSSAVYIWGAQAESSSTVQSGGVDIPTSYIQTTSSQVTRIFDLAQITGSYFSNFYNLLQGTVIIYADLNYISALENEQYFIFSGGVSNPYIWRNSGLNYNYLAGVGSSPITGKAANNIITYNMAYSYVANVGTVSTQNSGTLYSSQLSTFYPNNTTLVLGGGSNYYQINGHIKFFRYYPFSVSNTQLTSITQNPSG
jgi:hypothetical protein